MFGVELYGRVRSAVLGHGLSQREASRRFGIDRGTVSKMVSHSAPPGYRRTVEPRRPKLNRHSGFIDQILADDLSAPKLSATT
jgi:transposase